MGSRIVCIERNDKIRGLTKELRVVRVSGFIDTDELLRTAESSHPVPRSHLLELAETAESSCVDFLRAIGLCPLRTTDQRFPRLVFPLPSGVS